MNSRQKNKEQQSQNKIQFTFQPEQVSRDLFPNNKSINGSFNEDSKSNIHNSLSPLGNASFSFTLPGSSSSPVIYSQL